LTYEEPEIRDYGADESAVTPDIREELLELVAEPVV